MVRDPSPEAPGANRGVPSTSHRHTARDEAGAATRVLCVFRLRRGEVPAHSSSGWSRRPTVAVN